MIDPGAPARTARLRKAAHDLDQVDVDVYADYGRDPLEPIIGGGDPRCRVAFFGRDPGRHEVEHGAPFVGVGGQKIRRGLYEHLYGAPMPDFQASVDVGRYAFWANTVPYKPVGNKAWSAGVKEAFRPMMIDLLVNGWQGTHVIALGQIAYMWFADSRDERRRLKAFWERDDRFTTSLEVTLTAENGRSRQISLMPLPHPSPLNAVWAPHFPGLLSKRLSEVGLSTDAWLVDPC